MKKNLLSLGLLILVVGSAQAEWTNKDVNGDVNSGDFIQAVDINELRKAVYWSPNYEGPGGDIVYGDGNVGIGSSPSYAFEVRKAAGTGLISRIYNTTTGGGGVLIRAGEVGASDRVLELASRNDTKIMTVHSNGNVGIGTTSPSAKLYVSGGATFNTGANDQDFIVLDGDKGSVTNALWYDYSSGRTYLGNTGASGSSPEVSVRGDFETTGTVGIGTSSPAEKLHVNGGNARLTNGTYGRMFFGPSGNQYIHGDGASAFYLRSNDSTTSQIIFQDSQADVFGRVYAADGDYIGFLDGDAHWAIAHRKDYYTTFNVNNVERFRVGTSQSVTDRYGIAGTYNSAQVQGIWSIGDNYNIDTGSNDFGSQYGLGYSYNTVGGGVSGWGHQIHFLNNGTRYGGVSLSSGNIGVAAVCAADGSNCSTPAQIASLISSGGGDDLGDHTATTTLNLNANDIQKVRGMLLTWNTTYGTSFNHGIFSHDGNAYADNILINSYDDVRINLDSNNNDGDEEFVIGRHATDASSNLFTVKGTGNVGIGTGAPSSPLEVNAGAANKSVNLGISTGFPSGASSPSHGLGISRTSDGALASQFFAEGVSGQSLGIKARSDIHFYGNQTRNVSFLEGGNVGVGTATPSNRLHVNGNIGATGWIGAGCEGACEGGGGYSLMYANGTGVFTSGVTAGTLRVNNGNNVYFGSSDQRIHGDNDSALYLDSNHDDVSQIIFRDKQDDIYGRVYAQSGDYIGFLDGDGHWSYFTQKDVYHEWRINNARRMYVSNGGAFVYGNAEAFGVYGTDHAYIGFHPDGHSSTRRAYIGFGGATDNNLTIDNEFASGTSLSLRSDGTVVAGGTVSASTPTASSHLTTKAYVDAAISGIPGGDNLGSHTATTTLNMNSQGISSAQYLDMNNGSSYDVWIDGNGTTGASNRNLAMLGVKGTDILYVNYASEYSGGTVIGGPVTLGNQTPTAAAHAATKAYVDSAVSGAGGDNLGSGGTTAGTLYASNGSNQGFIGQGGTNYSRWDAGGATYYYKNGDWRMYMTATGFYPYINNSMDLGDASYRWGSVTAGTGNFSGAVTVATPTAAAHATTKAYVDSAVSGAGGDDLGNHTATTTLAMGTSGITSSAGTIRDGAGGWVRTYGDTGWYNGTYGGGWRMTDSTWLRAYGGKGIYTTSVIRGDNGFDVDGTTVINGSGGIIGDQIVDGSVDSTEIQDNTLTAADLAANSVGDSEMIDSPTFGGTVTATAFVYSSDRALKENLVGIGDAGKILELGTYRFDWKDSGVSDIGVIAQEVEAIYPEMVREGADGYKKVDYARLVVPLLEVTKNQEARIADLEARLEALEN